MGIFGQVNVNHLQIADYSIVRTAQIPGPDNFFAYACHFKYEDTKGYTPERWVFVAHRYRDGAPALMAKAWAAFAEALTKPAVQRQTAWIDFCDMHGLNYYEGLD